jgi:hypothetical protein
MTKTVLGIAASTLLVLLPASGCGYGPQHLPAFYSQRDTFQRFIDDIVGRMATDREWWSSLSPAERTRWRDYIEHALLEERERALNAMQSLDACLALSRSSEPGQRPEERGK